MARCKRSGLVGRIVDKGNGLFSLVTVEGHRFSADYKDIEPPIAHELRERIKRMSDAELVDFWRKLEQLP